MVTKIFWARVALCCMSACAQACGGGGLANEPDASAPSPPPACWVSLGGRGLPAIAYAVGFEVGDEYFAAAEQSNGEPALLRFDGEEWAMLPLDVAEDQASGAPVAIWAADPQHVFAAGQSQVWTFDGRVAQQVLAAQGFTITSLWGFAADDVWVAGYALPFACADCANPPRVELRHFDGSAWRAVSTGLEGRIDSLWGAAPDDVWAVGSAILHFDGQRWEHVLELSGVQAQVSGAAADQVFIALEEQAPMHFDGAEWKMVESDGLAARDVRAFADGSVFAYASSDEGESSVLLWDGDSFELSDWVLPSLDTGGHVRLSRYGDDLLLLDGRAWRRSGASFELWYEASPAGGLSFPTTFPAQPRGLLGVRNDTLVELADDRLRAVASVSLPARFDMYDLGARSAQDAWLVGHDGTNQGADAYHWDGEQLAALEVPLEGDFSWRQATVADSGALWIAGIALQQPNAEESGGPARVLRLDAAQWSDLSPDLGDIHGLALSITEDQAWASAGPNIIAVYEGDDWTRHDLPEGNGRLQSVSAAANDDVYAVVAEPGEDDGVLMHFDGEEWSAVEAVADYGVRQVSARGSGDVWVTGYAGRALVLRFDGEAWSELDTAHFEDVSIAVALGDDRAVFAGDLGTWLFDCDAAR